MAKLKGSQFTPFLGREQRLGLYRYKWAAVGSKNNEFAATGERSLRLLVNN